MDDGLIVSAPVVIEDATFFDPTSEPSRDDIIRPIVRIKDTSGVLLSSLTLVGTDATGDFRSAMVGEAGIDVLSSTDVTITDVTTVNVTCLAWDRATSSSPTRPETTASASRSGCPARSSSTRPRSRVGFR